MRPFLLILLALLTLTAAPASAAERVTLGFGRMFSNDFLADNHDRWRTGAYVVSWLRGAAGTDRRGGFGEVLEYRFASSIITPASLTAPMVGDRRYAGIMSFGLHSHFQTGATELSAGIDLVATGPQTGISDFQLDIHRIVGATAPSPAVIANQISNHLMPTAVIEAARPIALGAHTTLRPFVEAQAGAETFVRIGGDILIGPAFRRGIVLRDGVTGQLYQGVKTSREPGLSFLLGADVAHVAHSAYLPAADGYELSDIRARARAGVQWQGERVGVFYGVTWLGEEFKAQPEGQVLGSVNLQLNF